HCLARPPAEISLLEAVRVLEGTTAPAPCAEPGAVPGCRQYDRCVLAGIWRRVDEATQAVLGAVTLADLARQEREQCSAPMYYI
ncbi:MAG TPA: Rrf2 family transcriptional regulator, partial [Anaerolineae bacterium]|nr:Rrf2 family transcriptional regulator [Anaerolineae bacterium]